MTDHSVDHSFLTIHSFLRHLGHGVRQRHLPFGLALLRSGAAPRVHARHCARSLGAGVVCGGAGGGAGEFGSVSTMVLPTRLLLEAFQLHVQINGMGKTLRPVCRVVTVDGARYVKIGFCNTCWLYSLCNFQYRQTR